MTSVTPLPGEVLPPPYERGSLADVIPAAAGMIGAASALDPAAAARARALLPEGEARTVLVVLIDGLGLRLLRAKAAHAPFLRAHLPQAGELTAGFPSTTANSLSTLGTGLLPGAHGVVGYRLLDPARDVVFNQLSWDPAVDPRAWVPDETLFERLAAHGTDVLSLGEPKFAQGGLNHASMRGGGFLPSKTLSERVDHALTALRAPGRRLVYLYWGLLDKIGHGHGCESWQWVEELERVDAQLRRLAEELPRDARMLLTADHGMVDVPHEDRLDLAAHPDLQAGLRHTGGEPRAVHLYLRAGAEDDMLAAWRERTAGRAIVLRRADAIGAGLFGPVGERAKARMGDLIVIAREGFAVVDSARDSASSLSLLGHHGGLSDAELALPLMIWGS
ncbi:alkaline phosphatase family protein [Sediminivirga luteola]|uniref:Alkaline phosphatase family protein n=1 Tax=Sediminivirga luteola TaxID=1774748 RepID=A0A8J2XL01_9MICO|nr:alkaline phosphatase family protein [Sediminivirga luteola]